MAIEKTVLITGGSSGIGYTISRCFVKEGFRLLWVSLSNEEIAEGKSKMEQELPDAEIYGFAQDLSIDGAAQKVYDWTTSSKWRVDVLINNAGVGSYGFLHENDMQKEMNMIQLNVINLYALTRLYIKDMVACNQGTLINISSNTSFQPTPKLSAYGATKAFVKHFSRSIHEELKVLNSNVKVMCVCPAAIRDTNFKTAGRMENLKTFNGLATTTSEEVAKDVWNGYKSGKDFIISGWKMRLLYKISGIVPYSVQQFLVRKEIKEVV